METDALNFPLGPTFEEPGCGNRLGRWTSSHYQRWMKREPLAAFAHMVERHGNLVQFYRGRRRVTLVHEPHYIRDVLSNRASDYQKTRKRRPVFGDGVVTAEGETWKRQREAGQRFLQSLIHSPRFQTGLAELTDREIARWAMLPRDGFCLFSEITRLNLRLSLWSLLHLDPLPGELERFAACLDVLIRRRPSASALLNPLSRSGGTYRAALADYRRLLEELLRRVDRSGEDNLVGFLERELPPTGVRVPLFDQVSTYLLASSDTSASALSSAVFLLAGHEDCQQDVAASPGDMEKVRAVLKESMRLYPPVWLVSRQAVRKTSVGDMKIPAGSEVVLVPYLMHRRVDLWNSPEQFRPRRFLDAPAPAPGSYLPFGFGPRTCLGAQLMIHQGSRLLSTLLARFRIAPGKDAFVPEFHFTLRPRTPLTVRLEPR